MSSKKKNSDDFVKSEKENSTQENPIMPILKLLSVLSDITKNNNSSQQLNAASSSRSDQNSNIKRTEGSYEVNSANNSYNEIMQRIQGGTYNAIGQPMSNGGYSKIGKAAPVSSPKEVRKGISSSSHTEIKEIVANNNFTIKSLEEDIKEQNYIIGEEAILQTESAVTVMPVVLSQFSIEFCIEASLSLPKPALDIRSINKNIIIEQCQLMVNSNKLSIKGFVNEELEYTTADEANSQYISGHLEKCSFKIPFKYSTTVPFVEEARISKDIYCLDITSIDSNGEFSTGKVSYEINSWDTNESIYHEGIIHLKNAFGGKYIYRAIRKKILLRMQLIIFQNQNIFLKPTSFVKCGEN